MVAISALAVQTPVLARLRPSKIVEIKAKHGESTQNRKSRAKMKLLKNNFLFAIKKHIITITQMRNKDRKHKLPDFQT
jgi:hypothetical protein